MKKVNFKNIVLLYTSLYTISTMLNSIIYLTQGIYEDPSGNWHELDRAVIVFIVTFGIVLYRKLKIANKIISVCISYIITLACALSYIFVRGLFETLAKSAYKDMFGIITGFFILMIIIEALFNFFMKVKKKNS